MSIYYLMKTLATVLAEPKSKLTEKSETVTALA